MAHSEKLDQIIASSLIDGGLLEKLQNGKFDSSDLDLSADEKASLKAIFVKDKGAISQNIINVVNWFMAHYGNTAPVGYITHVESYIQTPNGPQLSLIPVTPMAPIHVQYATTPQPVEDASSSNTPTTDKAPAAEKPTPKPTTDKAPAAEKPTPKPTTDEVPVAEKPTTVTAQKSAGATKKGASSSSSKA